MHGVPWDLMGYLPPSPSLWATKVFAVSAFVLFEAQCWRWHWFRSIPNAWDGEDCCQG
jgi:hypothetical protein